MDKFTGIMKVTPQYSKCDPLFIYGNWELKDIGKPYKVWCNEGLWKDGINENICEIMSETNTQTKKKDIKEQ